MSDRSGTCRTQEAGSLLDQIGQGQLSGVREGEQAREPACGAAAGGLWLFGYGSLMWRPDLPYVERARAVVTGWHRSFCVASTHHRGTERRPGIVLGLDRGGACQGVAYRIAAGDAPATLAYLRRRELIYGVYREARVPARLADGSRREISALAYIVERAHPSWLGRLPVDEQALMIRGARGQSGSNLDYLINTVLHLAELGIREPALVRLAARAAGYALHVEPQGLARPACRAMGRSWSRQPIAARPLTIGERRRFMHRARIGSGSPAG